MTFRNMLTAKFFQEKCLCLIMLLMGCLLAIAVLETVSRVEINETPPPL